MQAQMVRLESEMKTASARATPEVRKRLNLFHNYVASYWMKLHGPQNISVAGCDHKTNNVIERYDVVLLFSYCINQKYVKLCEFYCVRYHFIECCSLGIVCFNMQRTLTFSPRFLLSVRYVCCIQETWLFMYWVRFPTWFTKAPISVSIGFGFTYFMLSGLSV